MQDAKAAQSSAEQIAAACQKEVSRLSTSLAAQHEAECMWQGRAEGVQQQLDQAMCYQQQLQQTLTTATSNVTVKEGNIRCTTLLPLSATQHVWMHMGACVHRSSVTLAHVHTDWEEEQGEEV